MERIRYDADLIKTMSLFGSLTRTDLKDCFVRNEMLVFVVDEKDISRAVGKAGKNVKQLEQLLNRKIKILGFTPDIIQFVKNIIYPLEAKDISERDGIVTIVGSDTRTKALLIGKNSQNLKGYLAVIQRYFDSVQNIKVI